MSIPEPTSADAALEVGSQFPETWFPFAGLLDRDLPDVSRLVDGRLSREPALAPRRHELVDLLTDFVVDLADQNALFGALRWTDAPVPGQGISYASATIDHGFDGATPDEVLHDVRTRVTAALAADPDAPKLDPADLPVGPALRLEAVRALEPEEEGQPAPTFGVVEYWIAPTAAGLPAGTVVHLAFLTTDPDQVPEVVEEYTAIAGHLWLRVHPA